MQREKNYHQHYTHIWVAEFSYGYHASEQQKPCRYRAQALIQANNQHQALVQLSDHILYSLLADEGQYEKILPLLQYLDTCNHLEKHLILNLGKMSEEQSILVLNSQDSVSMAASTAAGIEMAAP
ncbi:hypothetical protein [Xenorhabdus griffiniae]|uniref:Transposase n=1 Tax=Xenorhabdus griffiniae TaxID=351672 RepID=A0ABY9XGX2_9GAMM|nr:hypothetical protein [Xenorhabdus griffiniae]MBD1228681.1 hypothetical protein [Xenorhabdus griffiniae]MBE8588228.1 hypothetical protein [Xenorhabdus griffiniae]WMV72152.1 hypothetical protein QL128_18960 [Xenorhabdus griffiniae]WNH01830.1 hypothetical protein QL112_018970 [Xenorhabdus griffiniae]